MLRAARDRPDPAGVWIHDILEKARDVDHLICLKNLGKL